MLDDFQDTAYSAWSPLQLNIFGLSFICNKKYKTILQRFMWADLLLLFFCSYLWNLRFSSITKNQVKKLKN